MIVILLAGYGLVTQNFELQPFMIFFLGLLILVMRFNEVNKGRTGFGYLLYRYCCMDCHSILFLVLLGALMMGMIVFLLKKKQFCAIDHDQFREIIRASGNVIGY